MRIKILIVAAVLAAVPAAARAQNDGGLSIDLERSFRALYADPGNPGLTYGYAQLQIRAGNYEAAVASLERLLLQNPNQPRLLLELGVLYLRMGSFQLARAYLERARAFPNLPADVAQGVERYLGEASRRTSPSQFSGSLTLGLRYQTNANLASHAGQVFNTGFLIPNPEGPRGDFSTVLLGRVRHVFDFQTNDRTTWVTNAVLFASRYFRGRTNDLLYFELNAGPSFRILNESAPGSTIRPYGLFAFGGLGDRYYQGTGGGGVDLTIVANVNWIFDFSYQFRDSGYRNSPERPLANQLDGVEHGLRGRVGYQITENSLVLFEASGRFVNSRVAWQDFTEVGVSLGYILDYAGPFTLTPRPWSLSVSAAYFHRGYHAGDPLVLANRPRRENEWRLGLAHIVPITDWLDFVQQVDGQIVGANVPNYERRDLSVVLGARVRF